MKTKLNTINSARKLRKQAGYSAIEIVIGVVIAGLVTASIVAGALALYSDQKVDAESKRTVQMVNKLRGYYATSPDFTGVTTATAINIEAAAKDAVSGANITNKFGGTVALAPVNVVATNDGLQITHTGLSKSECNTFTKQVGNMFYSARVGATTVKADSNATVGTAALEGACTASNNTVVLVATKS